MTWYNPDTNFWLYLPESTYIYKRGFACFDLDWTLVRPSRGKFPSSPTDNVIMPNRISILKELQVKGYNIVIFTNQKLTPRNDINFKLDRMNDVVLKFKLGGIDILLFMATGEDSYRKPNLGMWNYMETIFRGNVIKSNVFYCGDAAGRPSDFSASDIEFGTNVGIKFYTPEELFE